MQYYTDTQAMFKSFSYFWNYGPKEKKNKLNFTSS